MTVVESKKLPANLFVRGTEVTGKVAEIRPQAFQIAQFVQAVVVEKGQDAVLEILDQRYLAQGEQELQPGQKLLLQVLQTQPQLEFKVVDGAADSSLERLLPLLTRSYDWTQLASVLDDSPEQTPDVKALVTLFAHLQNVASSEDEFSSALRDKVAVFLRSLGVSGEPPALAQPVGLPEAFRQDEDPGAFRHLLQLLNTFRDQLGALAKPGPVGADWHTQTRTLLTQLRQEFHSLEIPPAFSRQLLAVVLKLQESPSISPQLAADLQRFATTLSKAVEPKVFSQDFLQTPPTNRDESVQVAVKTGSVPAKLAHGVPRAYRSAAVSQPAAETRPDLPGQPRTLPLPLAGLQAPLSAAGPIPAAPLLPSGFTPLRDERPVFSPPAATPAAVTPPAATSANTSSGRAVPVAGPPEVEALLGQLKRLEPGTTVPPDVLGRLEGAVARLKHLQPDLFASLPVLDGLVQTLAQTSSSRTVAPIIEQLGVFSLLFGLAFEKNSFRLQDPDILKHLHETLLKIRSLPDLNVEEPLHRIEVLQLCRSRLADQQLMFLPLPFHELEEGYLLAKNQDHHEEGRTDHETSLQVSLSLRLSALGNLRVDLLYERQGLRLRLAGENQEKMNFLQKFSEDLEQALAFTSLHALSFSADAKHPAAQLQQRVLPGYKSLLDARI